MEGRDNLPLLTKSQDPLRCGLATLKDEGTLAHPVEAIQHGKHRKNVLQRDEMLGNVYGAALPAQLAIERQILSKTQRLPGLQSSLLGLESMFHELENFGFEAYLGQPGLSEEAPIELHAAMEAKLNMGTEKVLRSLP